MTLFYDVVGPAAVATGTARSQIDGSYKVPSAARELVGVRPWITADEPAAGDAILAVGDIIGSDYRYQPTEFLLPIGSGKLGTVETMRTTKIETWFIHAPLNGNETLDIGVEPCADIAAGGIAGMTMIYSTRRTGKETIFGKFSRETAGPTAVATTECADITLSNAKKMLEIIGVAVLDGVLVADQQMTGYYTMKCTVWRDIQTQKFFIEPCHAIEAAAGSSVIAGIERLPLDAVFDSPQATIETDFLNDVVLTNAGVLVHGLRYYGLRPTRI